MTCRRPARRPPVGVIFGYGTGTTSLDGVDLHVPAGTTLGRRGPHRIGQDHVGRLLARLWDTEAAGAVGGATSAPTWARPTCGAGSAVVTQEVELFRASVRDNLTVFGAVEAPTTPSPGPPPRRVRRPGSTRSGGARRGDLDGDTELSAGEGQLLAFARAPAADPDLVILDEASSRLDPETEVRLIAATDACSPGPHRDDHRPPPVDARPGRRRSSCSTTAAWWSTAPGPSSPPTPLRPAPRRFHHLLATGGVRAAPAEPVAAEPPGPDPACRRPGETASSGAVPVRLAGPAGRPRRVASGSGSGWSFFTCPCPIGLACGPSWTASRPPTPPAWPGLLALLAGFEIGRWLLLLPAIVQWHGAWVFWHTLPRVNALRSLTGDPGPVTGRLPGSSGEAVSRFRDDTRDVAKVLDVWLDLLAAGITIGGRPGDPVGDRTPQRGGHGAADPGRVVDRSPPRRPPPAVAVGGARGHRRGHRVHRRRVRRHRHGQDGGRRGRGARTASSRSGTGGRTRPDETRWARSSARPSAGSPATPAWVWPCWLVVPAVRRGDLSVGDIGLFTTYATAVGGLPRVTARWATFQRQGDVAAARLARLVPQQDPDRASATAPTWLRHGPPPFVPVSVTAPLSRAGRDRLDHLEVSDLGVHLDDGAGANPSGQLRGVDLTIRRGQFVVVTGPVGSGKSVLLRALLGLVPRSAGTVQWNGEEVADPSVLLVPPRAAYVPQVPRLCSEPLEESVLLGYEASGLDRVLALACLDDDLVDMPDGVRTTVGAKGVRLSGGQVQRVATARALIRRPELLVIDDLSSALDVTTEARLWDGLFAATDGNLTVLATSHRPRVLERADVVITLERGRRTG
jgi:ATP-binding cassette subfamily B protein